MEAAFSDVECFVPGAGQILVIVGKIQSFPLHTEYLSETIRGGRNSDVQLSITLLSHGNLSRMCLKSMP